MLKTALLASILTSCSPTHTQRPDRGPDTWALMQQACTRTGPDLATCNVELLKTAMRIAAQAEADRDLCGIELEKCNDLADVDCALWAGKVSDCEARLASPWRSPWLWGGVGLLLGTGLGLGLAR